MCPRALGSVARRARRSGETSSGGLQKMIELQRSLKDPKRIPDSTKLVKKRGSSSGGSSGSSSGSSSDSSLYAESTCPSCKYDALEPGGRAVNQAHAGSVMKKKGPGGNPWKFVCNGLAINLTGNEQKEWAQEKKTHNQRLKRARK